jgi:chemotaxis protein methyltransferase CheR
MATPTTNANAANAYGANQIAITDSEFEEIRTLLYRLAGISMSPVKKTLVESRLRKRLQALGLNTYKQYVKHIQSNEGSAELQTALDLLTTNETYFFREPQHFKHLREQVLVKRRPGSKPRIWSAACSSGEEPYSIAMLMADTLGFGDWEIMASDLSTQVLARARIGHYPIARTEGISKAHLQSYCLKGTGAQDGTLLIDRRLRSRVQFKQLNLIETLPSVGQFDVIFLRNVMIYFDNETKRRVIANLMPALSATGFLYIGHSETLNGVTDDVKQVCPAIYSKRLA